MTTGTIKFYNSEKGFGFVTANETKEDFFFYFKTLLYEPCMLGDKVTFKVVKSRKYPGKLEASEVLIAQ